VHQYRCQNGAGTRICPRKAQSGWQILDQRDHKSHRVGKITQNVHQGKQHRRKGVGKKPAAAVDASEDHTPVHQLLCHRHQYRNTDGDQKRGLVEHCLDRAVILIYIIRKEPGGSKAQKELYQKIQGKAQKGRLQGIEYPAQALGAGIQEEPTQDQCCGGEIHREKDEIQFGVASYPKNYKTGTHFHNHIEKETTQVDEILIVKEGCARVDFYNNEGIYIKSSEIFKDDTLIIFKGGHNISFNENTKLIVIKPSTYTQAYDKTRIIGVNDSDLIIEND